MKPEGTPPTPTPWRDLHAPWCAGSRDHAGLCPHPAPPTLRQEQGQEEGGPENPPAERYVGIDYARGSDCGMERCSDGSIRVLSAKQTPQTRPATSGPGAAAPESPSAPPEQGQEALREALDRRDAEWRQAFAKARIRYTDDHSPEDVDCAPLVALLGATPPPSEQPAPSADCVCGHPANEHDPFKGFCDHGCNMSGCNSPGPEPQEALRAASPEVGGKGPWKCEGCGWDMAGDPALYPKHVFEGPEFPGGRKVCGNVVPVARLGAARAQEVRAPIDREAAFQRKAGERAAMAHSAKPVKTDTRPRCTSTTRSGKPCPQGQHLDGMCQTHAAARWHQFVKQQAVQPPPTEHPLQYVRDFMHRAFFARERVAEVELYTAMARIDAALGAARAAAPLDSAVGVLKERLQELLTDYPASTSKFVLERDEIATMARALALPEEPNSPAAGRVEELERALRWCVDVVDAAGLLNLSNGVQLGQTVWYVKASDAFDAARRALATPTPGVPNVE